MTVLLKSTLARIRSPPCTQTDQVPTSWDSTFARIQAHLDSNREIARIQDPRLHWRSSFSYIHGDFVWHTSSRVQVLTTAPISVIPRRSGLLTLARYTSSWPAARIVAILHLDKHMSQWSEYRGSSPAHRRSSLLHLESLHSHVYRSSVHQQSIIPTHGLLTRTCTSPPLHTRSSFTTSGDSSLARKQAPALHSRSSFST